MFIGRSSKLYTIEVGDLTCLPDYNNNLDAVSLFDDDKVVILLEKNKKDTLLKGRELLKKLNDSDMVDVRVAFIPNVSKYIIFPNFIRVLRNHFRFRSSNIYHTSPVKLRDLGIERVIRNRSNAYNLKQVHRDENWRLDRFEDLCNKLKTFGYDDSKPMNIMICRQGGMLDSLKQGHHRISACIECGIERVAVQFSAAGYMPPLIARFFKRWKGKSISE